MRRSHRPGSVATWTSTIAESAPGTPPPDRCRVCGSRDLLQVLDLGRQPLSGVFPTPAEAATVERAQLRVAVCRSCWWLQLADDTPDEADAGGPPATATSTSIREHAEALAAWLTDDRAIRADSRILEVASHGNILSGFLRARGLHDTLTVEHREAAAAAARAAGLDIVDGRLDEPTAARLTADRRFDLVLDTFDLAHRRSPREELAGIARAIGREGIAVIEVEHALPVLEQARFDSVRHGHFGYPSLVGLQTAAGLAGLEIVATMQTSIYGGSIRAVLAANGARRVEASVGTLLEAEMAAGLATDRPYVSFAGRVATITKGIREHLVAARVAGRRVAGYGAPSRGSTLLNAAGIDRDLVPRTADVSPSKHGREIPGTGIPIVDPSDLLRDPPDEVLILTWTIADEIVQQLRAMGLTRCSFVVPLPVLRVIPA